MIKAKNISKDFGGIRALHDVSISCEQSMIMGLVGPNGSGKSTLVNVLTGMLERDSGLVTIQGGFGRTFQDVRVWEHMTVLENVLLMTQSRKPLRTLYEFRVDESKALDALKRIGLLNFMHTQARHLSYGQLKLLEIGRVLATESPNMFFDEPFAGLFPEMIERVKKIINDEKMRGASIVLIEHDMSIIRELCDHIVVLDAGKVIAEGNGEEVFNNSNVMEAYLGN